MTSKKRKSEQPDAQIVQGHVLDVLAGMEAESVSCCVTSPPYWSQRKYEAPDVTWPDGWRGQLGLEPTVELYVEHTMEWLRAVRRVLRSDGVCWVNLGDGYASNPAKGGSGPGGKEMAYGIHEAYNEARRGRAGLGTLKPKDLILMPSRVALAAQADGWRIRHMVIWNKPNAMPESCKDRPTTSHEFVLMLTKNSTYWYDSEAVREAAAGRNAHDLTGQGYDAPGQTKQRGNRKQDGHGRRYAGFNARWDVAKARGAITAGRNMRSVWTFPTAQTPEAHFATFPEELPKRCILASAPQAICSKCGEARVRVVETRSNPAGLAGGEHRETERDGGLQPNRPRDYVAEASIGQSTTTGWTACKCKAPSYVPGLVLDPFAGVGTTGVVARRLGRRFVGIELSEKYCAMAAKRMEQTTLGIPL